MSRAKEFLSKLDEERIREYNSRQQKIVNEPPSPTKLRLQTNPTEPLGSTSIRLDGYMRIRHLNHQRQDSKSNAPALTQRTRNLTKNQCQDISETELSSSSRQIGFIREFARDKMVDQKSFEMLSRMLAELEHSLEVNPQQSTLNSQSNRSPLLYRKPSSKLP